MITNSANRSASDMEAAIPDRPTSSVRSSQTPPSTHPTPTAAHTTSRRSGGRNALTATTVTVTSMPTRYRPVRRPYSGSSWRRTACQSQASSAMSIA